MLNKAQIIGRVGNDPDVRSFQNGDRVANISVATSETWKDKSTGEKKEKTEWHRISIMNQSAVNFVESYVKKGDLVYVEGTIQTRKWTDKDGVEKYSTEIVVRPFGGVLNRLTTGGKPADEAPAPQTAHHEAKANGYAPQQPRPAVIDDDIPF